MIKTPEVSTTANDVVILDAGAQYAKLIDRSVRELGVKSHLLPMNTTVDHLNKFGAIIISGGPESVYDAAAPTYDPELFSLQLPILGICYGMQLFSHTQGGEVEKKSTREDGPCDIEVSTDSPLFAGLEPTQQVLMTHGDSVDKPGTGFKVIAMSGDLIAAIENQSKQWYGVQFHPEVELTTHGSDILANFLFKIAKLEASYTLANREQLAIEETRAKVGTRTAISLISGGVDSTVSTVLAAKALGSHRVFAIHVDTGLMRQNESAEVIAALEALDIPVKLVNAQDLFANATTIVHGQQTPPLNKCTDPEQKRKIIGDTFMKVAEKAVADLHLQMDEVVLIQGTLRPDLIESGSGTVSQVAHTIKTHHNNTASVRALRDAGQVIEPLAELHKDEVRELGESLGLPEELVWRQPFPGPGLAIRALCAEEPYKTKDFGHIQDRLHSFTSEHLSAHLLPIQTVGIQGDARTYSYLAGLSGQDSWTDLAALARAIPKKIHQINRVVYLFGDQLPHNKAFTGITPTHLTPDVLDQLRHADHIVNVCLKKFDLLRKISQVPVILFPADFGIEGNRSIGIRTFITRDFMTGLPAIPGQDIPEEAVLEMVERILAEVPQISRVAYDLTSKPPGTTEWE